MTEAGSWSGIGGVTRSPELNRSGPAPRQNRPQFRMARGGDRNKVNTGSFCPRLFSEFTIEWSMEYWKILERVKGLEPSTCAMATRRSSQLSYTRFGKPRFE